MSEAAILRETMTDRADIFREVLQGGAYQQEQVYQDLPCALSRNYQGSRPRLIGPREGVAESEFFLMIFLPAGTVVKAGDRAEVRREGQIYKGICGPSLGYPSYAVASLEVEEVGEL